jgi:hypothetical protein
MRRISNTRVIQGKWKVQEQYLNNITTEVFPVRSNAINHGQTFTSEGTAL